jgi:hypothetical protein
VARRTSLMRNGQLQQLPGSPDIPVGTAEWYAWLENLVSFSCETSSGTMTVRKERRPGSSLECSRCSVR